MKLSEKQKLLVKKYGPLFNNTGGNDIIELIERDNVNYFNNPIVAELQGCCYSQLCLIQKLLSENLINEMKNDCTACNRWRYAFGMPANFCANCGKDLHDERI